MPYARTRDSRRSSREWGSPIGLRLQRDRWIGLQCFRCEPGLGGQAWCGLDLRGLPEISCPPEPAEGKRGVEHVAEPEPQCEGPLVQPMESGADGATALRAVRLAAEEARLDT